jgi:hypothetical protein
MSDRFHEHITRVKWQGRDKKLAFQNQPRGVARTLQDFAENGSLAPKFEHQSRYFTEQGYSVYTVALFWHIDDYKLISEEEREKLRALFVRESLPPVICEAIGIISADLTHDAAFVQAANDKHLTPYIKATARENSQIALHDTFSDGCPTHFELSQLSTFGFQSSSSQLAYGEFGASVLKRTEKI